MQKKILHLVTDEKFTDYAIKQFSAPEMCSEFVLIPSNFSKGESEVKAIDKVTVIEQNSEEFEHLLQNLYHYSAIILHGMHWPNWQIPLLNAVPQNVKVAWVFWGGELYAQPDVLNAFLSPLDKFLNETHILRRKLIGKRVYNIAYVNKEDYRKIEFCLTAMPIEYEYAKKYLKKPQMKYLWYNYYSIEQTLGCIFNRQCDGRNIWIGNSATISCNYFDLLLKIKNLGFENRDIIIPLSYGEPWLKKRVAQAYSFVFGKHFMPLLDFLPRNEYNTKMLSCAVMIQPHYLAQGIGNILTGLWLGMRVYLSEKCISYEYLRSIGVTFFSIEHDLRKDNPNIFEPLSQNIIEHNRKMLMKETGLQKTIEANKLIVTELTKD